MSPDDIAAPRERGAVAATGAPTTRREIGRAGDDPAGPTLLVVAAIHGNETAGVGAVATVLETLQRRGTKPRGRMIGIVGNLAAVAAGVRYRDVDLNRAFTNERVARVRAADPAIAGQTETAEQRELLAIVDELLATARGPVHALDLHTSSSEGAPFATVGDTLRNRAFAMHFPVPRVLGIEEQIDGALLEHLSNRGCMTLGFEGGQHDDPDSSRRHEALVWVALVASGMLPAEAVPDLAEQRGCLERAARELPDFVEVRRRHAIRPDDGFAMAPGFTHFQRVRRGDVLAHDRHGTVRSTEDGLVLLPLYQKSGDDGFFLGRAVRPAWLTISALVRRAGLPNTVAWLPGVRRRPGDRFVVEVDRRIARFFAIDVFHLLGFRKRRENGDVVVLERRRE